MSATGRSDVRVAGDFYSTPAWCTRALLDNWVGVFDDTLDTLDPCCGVGAILEQVSGFKRGIELNPMHAMVARSQGPVFCGDALELPWGAPKIVLTNPPYSLAEPFIRKALSEITRYGVVAMLLRLDFMSAKKRRSWLKQRPFDLYVLNGRPSFTGKGTDATNYAWFVWSPDASGRFFLLP